VEQQETDMNTQNVRTSLLSDDELDAVVGGIKNDPPTTHTKLIEFATEIANTKALGPIAEFPI
jgi:hypothetical protein